MNPSNTARLRNYNRIVVGWLREIFNETNIDLFVRTNWLTKAQGEEIKKMDRKDPDLLERFEQQLRTLEMQSTANGTE